MIDLKSSINDVLSNIRCSDIFLPKIGVDIFVDKDKRLSEVLAEKNININSTFATLNLFNEVADIDMHWLLEPTANLIEHIKSRYHNRHRLQLPILISLAQQVELTNQENSLCPTGLADYLKRFHNDFLMHMENEEQILFPFLTEKNTSYSFTQVSLAMHNHDHDIHILKKIDWLTNNLTLPEHAKKVWKKLYVGLVDFKEDLLEHIRLENDILFEKCS